MVHLLVELTINTIASGLDYLGWVHFTCHRVLRTTTKRRMMRRIQKTKGKEETVQSYLGLLRHGNTKGLQAEVKALATEMVRTGVG